MKQTIQLKISGMHCASCSQLLTKVLSGEQGVVSANVNYGTQKATISFDADKASVDTFIAAVAKAGYHAELPGSTASDTRDDAYLDSLKLSFIISMALAVPAMLLSMIAMGTNWLPVDVMLIVPYILWVLATPVQFYVGAMFYRGAWAGLKNKTASMDTLIALGTSAAYFYSVVELLVAARPEQYFEVSAMLIGLVVLGKLLEERAKKKAHQAIQKLVALTPKTARILQKGKEVLVAVEDVHVGYLVLLRPGERVAVDGIVTEGQSSIDESMITGESIPVQKIKKSVVIGGTLNGHGRLIYKATSVGTDTVLAQIVKLMEDAQGRKAPIERFADRVSAVFVPIVLLIAVATFGVWYGIIGASLAQSLMTSVAVLVIACPWSLRLATPTAILVGTGLGAKNGILMKGGDVIESSAKVTDVIFDKTGTLTKGIPEVTDIITAAGIEEAKVLQLAASLEQASEHPLADAIVRRAKKDGIETFNVTKFEALPGKGVRGIVRGEQITIGTEEWFTSLKIIASDCVEESQRLQSEGKTTVFIARKGKCIGLLAIADQLKESAARAVQELKSMGITPHLLTGDRQLTAQAIAAQAGIDVVKAEVLPAQKSQYVEEIAAKGTVVMVGDGINDAPALARAHVGIAMGSGTDIAMEAGDIVLMRSDPADVAKAIRLGRKVLSKIRQNLFWALIYNILGIPLAAGVFIPITGWTLSPLFAGGAMALSSVSVVTSSLLLNRQKKL